MYRFDNVDEKDCKTWVANNPRQNLKKVDRDSGRNVRAFVLLLAGINASLCKCPYRCKTNISSKRIGL